MSGSRRKSNYCMEGESDQQRWAGLEKGIVIKVVPDPGFTAGLVSPPVSIDIQTEKKRKCLR